MIDDSDLEEEEGNAGENTEQQEAEEVKQEEPVKATPVQSEQCILIAVFII